MGNSGILESDLSYKQVQFLQNYPIKLSNFDVLDATVEVGKSFDLVPLTMLFPVPSNQTFHSRKTPLPC